tara:strand:- start:78 stop:338 length:261 start_codon:yes stop_codon:yes gene_type:complete
MIYTPKIKSDVHKIPVPHEFAMDVMEYDLHPPYIGLRFYESHWRHMSEKERINCIFYLKTIKEIIEAHGVNVTIDPVYDVPGGQTY